MNIALPFFVQHYKSTCWYHMFVYSDDVRALYQLLEPVSKLNEIQKIGYLADRRISIIF